MKDHLIMGLVTCKKIRKKGLHPGAKRPDADLFCFHVYEMRVIVNRRGKTPDWGMHPQIW